MPGPLPVAALAYLSARPPFLGGCARSTARCCPDLLVCQPSCAGRVCPPLPAAAPEYSSAQPLLPVLLVPPSFGGCPLQYQLLPCPTCLPALLCGVPTPLPLLPRPTYLPAAPRAYYLSARPPSRTSPSSYSPASHSLMTIGKASFVLSTSMQRRGSSQSRALSASCAFMNGFVLVPSFCSN